MENIKSFEEFHNTDNLIEGISNNPNIMEAAKDLNNILNKYIKNYKKIDLTAISMRSKILINAIDIVNKSNKNN